MCSMCAIKIFLSFPCFVWELGKIPILCSKRTKLNFFKIMSVLGLAGFYSVPLYAKTPKEIVKYQSTPKDGNACKSCLHFIAETNECKTVEGSIDPEGWCSIYFKLP